MFRSHHNAIFKATTIWNRKKMTPLEQKRYVKYLGVLIDGHLSWRHHIDYFLSKISKGVGIIAIAFDAY